MLTRIGETKKKKDFIHIIHLKPQSCKNITVLLIKKGIWPILPRKDMGEDLKLQHFQSTMWKTLYPLTHLMAKLLNAQTGKQALSQTHVYECFALCNDILKLLQVGFSELSVRIKKGPKTKTVSWLQGNYLVWEVLGKHFFKSWMLKM